MHQHGNFMTSGFKFSHGKEQEETMATYEYVVQVLQYSSTSMILFFESYALVRRSKSLLLDPSLTGYRTNTFMSPASGNRTTLLH